MAKNAQYSLLFKKENDTVKDLVEDFNIVCLEVPMAIKAEIKDLSATDFAGENGEEVYFPAELVAKAFDWKVKLGCLGNSTDKCVVKINNFINYCKGADGKGTKLSIASSYTNVGREGCYLKEFSTPEFSKDGAGYEMAQFEVTFRITNPLNLITLS